MLYLSGFVDFKIRRMCHLRRIISTIFIIICMYIVIGCMARVSSSSSSNTISCNNKRTINETIKVEGNGIIIVNKDINLNGKEWKLPLNSTLVFKGGVIRKGTLIGNNTKIASSGNSFDHVTIKGIWNVPNIDSNLFVDLSYDNALIDLLALTNPKVNNRIEIRKGNYHVTVKNDKGVCVKLYANTDLQLDGNIHLTPNHFSYYDIISVTGENIKISGNGSIIGDKENHKGKRGEWGMGIRFQGARNASVMGITISDCWGDCVYIGGDSKNVTIENCKLSRGRRQGISVTRAEDIFIRNCTISEVGGRDPQYAIDIEPNKDDIIKNVTIDHVVVKDCIGGFLVTGEKKDGSSIKNIVIKDCQVSAKTKSPILIRCCNSATVERCIITAAQEQAAIIGYRGRNLVVRNNIIEVNKAQLTAFGNVIRNRDNSGVYTPITLNKCESKVINNNRIVEK